MNMVDEILINDTYVRNIKSVINKDYADYDVSKQETEPAIVESIIRTQDFMKVFNSSMNLESGILPENCKYVRNLAGNSKIFVLEEEPKLRTVSFNFDPFSMLEILKQNGKYDTFNLSGFKTDFPFKLTLSIPYVVYVLYLKENSSNFDLSLFFRLAPITSMDDYLLEPCLPNISDDYHVCLGPTSMTNDSVNHRVKNIIDSFWFNSFNYDYFSHCNKYKEVPEVSDLFTYAYNSKKDPMFIFSTKWFDTGYTLNDILKSRMKDKNFYDFTDVFRHFQLSIKRSQCQSKIDDEDRYNEKRVLSDSVCLSNDCIISIGDEIQLNEIKYYINSFKYNQYDSVRFCVLEDENNNIVEREINDDFLNQVQIQFGNKEIKTIVIGEEELSEGDIVYFNDSENIKTVEKIIQTKDNMKHIKIGREFYLESSFLNKTLKKFKGNLEFGGVQLVKDAEYVFISTPDLSERTLLYFSCFKATFKTHNVRDGKIMLHFIQGEREKNLYLTLADSKMYKIIDPNILKPTTEIFRINDQIVTKELFYIDKVGFCKTDETRNFSDLNNIAHLYDSTIGTKYFTDFCNNKLQELNFKSFDFDINYKIGDSVIHIDWNNPVSMLKIQKITNFIIEDNYFKLTLTDENDESKNISLINLISGQGEFTSIRQVCDQINEMRVGMKMQPTVKGIQDFPMKDNYEIKAFIIDSGYPMVLFSNGRTLYFEYMMKNFVIVNNKSKRSLNPPAEFNLNIKIQDGDIFMNNSGLIQLVYSSAYNKMYEYCLSPGGYYSYRVKDLGSYLKSVLKSRINIRRGLLTPRISDAEIKTLNTVKGHPSIFSEIWNNLNTGWGIRQQDLSFLKTESKEVEEVS